MLGELVEIVPRVWQFAYRLLDMDNMCHDLRNVIVELRSIKEDMERTAAVDLQNTTSRRRRRVVGAFFLQVQDYQNAVEVFLAAYVAEAQHWWIGLNRIRCFFAVERYLAEGRGYLVRGSELMRQGLTHVEVTTRRERLPVGELMGATAQAHLEAALQALNRPYVNCIGIYGSAGAGKTNLMKHIYNVVYDNVEGFKAVFWATAPREQSDMALQNCVAEAMNFDLNDDDVVRRASLLAGRLDDLGPGRKILFLDNLRHNFSAHEIIGFPCSRLECILVFTAASREVCNRMHCRPILEMNLLPMHEAEELFLQKAGRPTGDNITNLEQMIQNVAIDVANECARMPLAIILIARSMEGIDDIREWRNRLNELLGRVVSINGEENKILEQLRFAYESMNLSETEQECFKAAARMLVEDQQLAEADVVQAWQGQGTIGGDRPPELVGDQGRTIVNRLRRMCLVEVEGVGQNRTVAMNKWIRNMAATI